MTRESSRRSPHVMTRQPRKSSKYHKQDTNAQKVETYATPRSGKGLCVPVIDKSLLSKSKTGSIAVFRDACHVATKEDPMDLTIVAVYTICTVTTF